MNEPGDDGKGERKWLTQWVPGIVLWLLIGAILVDAIFQPWNWGPEMSKRSMCCANMSGIGKGILLYQCDHDDLSPPNLAALVASGQPKDLLICPSSGTEKSPTTQPADIAAHCDYIYAPLPANMENGKELVMAFELPANHRQDIVNVVFNDYHVETIQMGRFMSLVQELNDYHAGLRWAEP